MEIYLADLHYENKYELSEDIIYIEDIDQGSFGKVIHAKDKLTKRDLSVKIINKKEADQISIKKMKEEISILKKLNHKNIVKFYGHIETLNQILIKMEYIRYGTLSQWIKKNKKISEEDASLIIKNIISAVSYLHNNQICHRDIKPQNIMFSKENDLNSIKLIDFGLSVQNFDSLYNSDYCGTFIYMAPEEINKKSYDLSIDVWSIGILMYMLLNKGEHPFYHKGDTKQDFINNLENIKNLKFNNKMSYMAVNLLKRLLEPDPLKRYKAGDALKHPWITRNIEDLIPQTLSDQLGNNNIKNNMKEIIMSCIFLNYLKKNNAYLNNKGNDSNNKKEDIISNIVNRNNKKKIGIYKISYEYLKKCEYISKIEKEKLKELKEKYLNTASSFIDDLNEKNYSNEEMSNNTKSNTISRTNSNNSNILSYNNSNNNHNSNIIINRNSLSSINNIIDSNTNSNTGNSNFIINSNNNININNNQINNFFEHTNICSYYINKNLFSNNHYYSNKNILKNNSTRNIKPFKSLSTKKKNNKVNTIQKNKQMKLIYKNMSEQKFKNFFNLSPQKTTSSFLNCNNFFITQLGNSFINNTCYKSISKIKNIHNNETNNININNIKPNQLFLNNNSEIKPIILKSNINLDNDPLKNNINQTKNKNNFRRISGLFKLPKINKNNFIRKNSRYKNSYLNIFFHETQKI